jgi:hypothetical protein
MSAPRLRPRAIVASLSAVAGALVFRLTVGTDEKTIYIPITALVVGAIVIHLRPLGAQLLGRALFWSNLVLGALICFLDKGPRDRSSSLALLFGAGVALLLAERRALAEASASRGERPAAFAGTIELLMVLALADAQTCVLFAAIDRDAATPLFLAAAAALLVGFVGLYRLALWGVIVTMSTATVLAAALLGGMLRDMRDVAVPLTIVFAAQLLAPLPMIASIVTKRPLPAPSPRVRSALASGFVGLLMLASVVASFSR